MRTLVYGTLLASGRCTVTAALRAIGRGDERHFTRLSPRPQSGGVVSFEPEPHCEERLKTEQYFLIVGSFHASLQAHSVNRRRRTVFLNECPLMPNHAICVARVSSCWRQVT